jgi:acetyl-CoA C-acetyltransferase
VRVAALQGPGDGVLPVSAVTRLSKTQGLKVEDIRLWDLNEAFACQVLYCCDRQGIDPQKLNVYGRGISIGHPYR